MSAFVVCSPDHQKSVFYKIAEKIYKEFVSRIQIINQHQQGPSPFLSYELFTAVYGNA
jgi:hypothetical protein